MKTLATLIRHGVTYLVGLLVAWFAIHLTASDDLKTATDAANALVEPLVIVAGFVAVILARLVLPFFSALFLHGTGESKSGGESGGALPLALGWIAIGTAAVMGFLPSCSPGLDGEYPLTASLSYRDPNTGAKAGLTYTPKLKLRGGVTVPVYDAETGEQIGTTTIQIDPASGK